MPDSHNQDESYFLEKNPDELQRLTLLQELMLNFMGNLISAPLDTSQPGLEILDSGTAGGAWIWDVKKTIEFTAGQDVASRNRYTGTDITPAYFPDASILPENVRFYKQSILEPWPEAWKERFDLVHQRSVLPCAAEGTVEQVIERMIALVKPGGYIQFIEADHSHALGDALQDMSDLFRAVFETMGFGFNYAERMEGWFKDAGLLDVKAMIMDVPIGQRNPQVEMQRKSVESWMLGLPGLLQAARGVPSRFTDRQLDDLPSRVESELNDIGGIHRMYCVWGRTPGLTER